MLKKFYWPTNAVKSVQHLTKEMKIKVDYQNYKNDQSFHETFALVHIHVYPTTMAGKQFS